MNNPNTIHDQQLGELVRFLDEHPGFSPVFCDDAILCGFRVGTSCLSLDNVQELFFVPREQRLARLLTGSERLPVVDDKRPKVTAPAGREEGEESPWREVVQR